MQSKTIAIFWRYAKPYRLKQFVGLIGASVSILVESFIAPLVLAQFMNKLQSGSVTLENSWQLIVLYAAILFASTVITWRITLWATWTFEASAQRDLGAAILNHLTQASAGFHANRFGGALISQAGKLVTSLERFWDLVIWEVIPVVTSVVAASVILWFISPGYSLFIIALSITFAVTVFMGSRFLLARNLADVQAWSLMTGYISDVIGNVATVKSFGREQFETKETTVHYEKWLGKSLHNMRGFLGASSAYATISVIIMTGALLFAVIVSQQKGIEIGSIFLMLTYTMIVTRQLWGINNIMRNYNRLMGDSHDMVEILNTPIDIKDTSTDEIAVTKGDVTFDKVSFAHDNGKGVHIFDDFSLVIPAGQRVGVVGHSGSGKTTLTRLLLRFSDIDKGQIQLDGQNIADFTQQSVRRSIAYVAQEPLMFHRTLRENISYGRPDATDEEVMHAAKLAHAHEFIKTMSEGYDTVVGERGVKLSGGQRQRIAIARALLKDAPILVLDEATSALDSESEKLIQDSLGRLMKGRTSIVIAHRLSTISKLDRIIVLENGTIIEDGTHDELTKKNGVYAKLWSHQSGGFIEE